MHSLADPQCSSSAAFDLSRSPEHREQLGSFSSRKRMLTGYEAWVITQCRTKEASRRTVVAEWLHRVTVIGLALVGIVALWDCERRPTVGPEPTGVFRVNTKSNGAQNESPLSERVPCSKAKS